jgi:hypothetical protein
LTFYLVTLSCFIGGHMPIPIPRVHSTETCPLEGYEALQVRILANTSDAEWKRWCAGNLGMPGCPDCQKRAAPVRRGKKPATPPAEAPRLYCPACQAARVAYGESIVLLYGPELLGEDVSTPAAALALFDRDDALPSELVIWLQLLPGVVRSARQDTLLGNLTRS